MEEKVKQKHYYDLKTKDQTFAVGDFALVFRLTLNIKLLNLWQRPYPITEICYTGNLPNKCGGKG